MRLARVKTSGAVMAKALAISTSGTFHRNTSRAEMASSRPTEGSLMAGSGCAAAAESGGVATADNMQRCLAKEAKVAGLSVDPVAKAPDRRIALLGGDAGFLQNFESGGGCESGHRGRGLNTHAACDGTCHN